ncbi:hypothetical protein IM060_001456 [Escherichia coli]|nr:hypothetical protein [Escherichia coli]EER8145873.1 hypothetical protein [Escherichia coli]EER9584327.1 hypothetical protein [Escherichia coli]EES0664900.1 hypothetical protein [Escherichia coli]EES0717984.1 hypothetical protein [Escherichia coli]
MARLLTIVFFFSISASAVTARQFQRELDLADKAILWALISASTKEGRKACSLTILPVRPQRLNSDWHIWLRMITRNFSHPYLI